MGQRLNIIIIAEGAIDSDGKKITPDDVKNVRISAFVYRIIFFKKNNMSRPVKFHKIIFFLGN
jgi:hypothetical protein